MTDDSSDKTQAGPVNRRREVFVLLAALGLGAVVLIGIYALWNYDRKHPVTDDALLRANYVWIRPQVEGQVVELYANRDQFVKAGEPLFLIDPRPYRHHLAKAEKTLLLVRQANDAGKAAVEAARAQVEEQEAMVETAQQYAKRYEAMAQKQAASQLSAISYQDALASAQGKLSEQKADLAKVIAELGSEEVQAARIEKAQADVELARLKLEWTRVLAPADGYVTRLNLRVGDVVQPDTRLFPFIESAHWWVQANFKETDMKKIRVGMPATVTIDTYGDRQFKGEVESISAGAAASFALLPPQNTTGNWVKVTQRIPVRVRLQAEDPKHPYRFGSSASVTVDVADTSAASSNAAPGSR